MPRIKRTDSQIPKALAHIEGLDVKAVLRKRGMFLKQRRNQELKAAARPIAEKLIKGKKAKTVVEVTPPQKYISFTDEVVKTYVEKAIRNVDALEKQFNAAINKYLMNTLLPKAIENIQEVADTKALKKVVTKKMVFDTEDKAYLINQARIQLEPYLQNMAVIGGQHANGLIDIDDPYIPSEALRKRIQGNVAKFTESMVETDQEHLSGLITAGIDDGLGVPEITSSIKSDFANYSKMQAERITRTEVLRSANQSAIDAYKQSGVVEGKQWVAYQPDDDCADLDGEVVTLDGNFYGDTSEFQDGDPPLHPNCKCITIPVLSNSDESS